MPVLTAIGFFLGVLLMAPVVVLATQVPAGIAWTVALIYGIVLAAGLALVERRTRERRQPEMWMTFFGCGFVIVIVVAAAIGALAGHVLSQVFMAAILVSACALAFYLGRRRGRPRPPSGSGAPGAGPASWLRWRRPRRRS
ncbi:hypothetical protein [Frankia sp. Cas4]|uniref:hypothetical protein n=1 Tax=Frankia sp. Cas4 TaxID=3073927 RepID=UPI002AD40C4E|nr:hypothetical protein [Frankia sp. Cas4]